MGNDVFVGLRPTHTWLHAGITPCGEGAGSVRACAGLPDLK